MTDLLLHGLFCNIVLFVAAVDCLSSPFPCYFICKKDVNRIPIPLQQSGMPPAVARTSYHQFPFYSRRLVLFPFPGSEWHGGISFSSQPGHYVHWHSLSGGKRSAGRRRTERTRLHETRRHDRPTDRGNAAPGLRGVAEEAAEAEC